MAEMTIRLPEPIAKELLSVQDRLPEVLAYGLKQLTPLINPRTQVWDDHFRYNQGIIIPLTPEGRVAVFVTAAE